MQIYDKICDCVDLFNNIYPGQVFIMFNSWLLCTLLIICRSLSPTVKYSDIILSDIFVYTNLNIRPLMLAKMSELFMEQRKRTLKILLNIITYNDLEYVEYTQQLETMLDLVETRKWEISANVFTVDVSTVLNFAGRIISYTVLMIQYFYIHVFVK
ncbi:uncharacterized protein LOC115444297 [Manduca sexta]|uniref:uncharacterized protein LOC115444297 n=1 Tax=Manduca sexta TaxID=7130 RepID=UPI00188DF8C4|nr:uncharacterized protein LOC115444297 [Manduca sexta]